MIAHESGVSDTIDPLGGAYAIERLTDELQGRAEEYIAKVDTLGGMVQAIERGYPQSEIQDSAYEAQKELEEKRSIVVGVNAFQQTESPPQGLLRVDEKVQQIQIDRLKVLRSQRNNEAVKQSLEALRAGALRRENLIPLILDAVKASASLGEISDTMRTVFGEYKEHVVL